MSPDVKPRCHVANCAAEATLDLPFLCDVHFHRLPLHLVRDLNRAYNQWCSGDITLRERRLAERQCLEWLTTNRVR